MTEKLDYDYVIIGSGFGGSVSALRLSEKGYKVLIIEKGKWYSAKDFPKTNWNLKKWLWLPTFNLYGILKLTFFRHVSVLSGVGVGGGSLVYANTLPRPRKQFFESGNWAGLENWNEALAPYYAVAEKMLGATKNPKFFDADISLRNVASKMGIKNSFEAPNVAVYFGKPNEETQDPYFNGKGPSRSGCTYCGQCMTGCPNNAKNTLDKNYLFLAQKLGAKIIAEKTVKKVKPLHGKNGEQGYEVEYQNSLSFIKDKKSVRTKGIIFSGGVLGTVRLLLDMKHKKHLPNLSDEVGNHIRTNNENLSLINSRKKNIDLSKGVAIGSIFPPDEHGHVEAVRYGKGSGFWKIPIIPMVYGKNIFTRLVKLIMEMITKPKDWFGMYFTKKYAEKTVILLFMQHLDSTIKLKRGLFNLSSRISSGKKPTPFIPMAKTIANHMEKEIDGKAFMMSSDVISGAPSTAHILGGAVIGRDVKTGVIDKNQRVFGYKNMYVCDGSAMSANPGVNPSLTICAMTERAMSFIPDRGI